MINEGHSYASSNPWSFSSQVSNDGVLSVDVVAVEIATPGEMTWFDPIPMILHCPECGGRHVDQGEFATKPHHTHACQHCGLPWRPALVATVGVQFLPGFKD
jgi:hypothetical protein